jgi:hypothetical protein
LLAKCRVERNRCADEPPDAEAESSATHHDEMGIGDCCDC